MQAPLTPSMTYPSLTPPPPSPCWISFQPNLHWASWISSCCWERSCFWISMFGAFLSRDHWSVFGCRYSIDLWATQWPEPGQLLADCHRAIGDRVPLFQKEAKNTLISFAECSVLFPPQRFALDFSESFQSLSLGWIRFSGCLQLHSSVKYHQNQPSKIHIWQPIYLRLFHAPITDCMIDHCKGKGNVWKAELYSFSNPTHTPTIQCWTTVCMLCSLWGGRSLSSPTHVFCGGSINDQGHTTSQRPFSTNQPNLSF